MKSPVDTRTGVSGTLDPLGLTRTIWILLGAVGTPFRLVSANTVAVSPGKYIDPTSTLTEKLPTSAPARTRKFAEA